MIDKNKKIAVVGVSANKEKWGWKIFSALKANGYKVYPVNPKYDLLYGVKCYKRISDIPERIDVVITVVPPNVTEKIVKECFKLGIKNVWMQPGSESKKAIDFCKKHNIKVATGRCIVLDFQFESD